VKPFQLSDPASAELTGAIRWYERQRAGLGRELFDAIAETIDLIRTHPEIGEPRGGTQRPTRQMLVTRFPYLGLIRIGGHLSYGGYDVQTDGRHTEAAASAPPVH
jgi:plasmid stabilization system protein ParE